MPRSMMDPPGKVLVVEDDPAMRLLVAQSLRKRGFEPLLAASASEASSLFEASEPDAVVTDIRLGGMTGLELCAELSARRADVPVLVVTAFSDLDTAIAAIRAGAHDFLPKPFELEELALRLSRAVELSRLRREVRRLREERSGPPSFEKLVGESESMKRLFAMIAKLATSGAPVLVQGETGTGKELVARALHARSARASGPFVALNCAAVPEALLESELFGHVKGAFTDARAARAGLFVEATGGTLFLDEVAELPLPLQAKLLRALQEHRVRPVGSDREVEFDARILSATHRDLEARVEAGLFREDLYYRLAVLPLRVPPLRERTSDVLPIAHSHLTQLAERSGKAVVGISPEAARKLIDYAWPGNVRELLNAVERAVALAEHDQLVVGDLPEKIQGFKPSQVLLASYDPSELVTLEEVDRRYILKVVELTGGNRTRAAEVLGIDRKTLYSKLKSYGEKPPEGG